MLPYACTTMPGKAAVSEPNEAPFVYVRRHGSHGGTYSGSYTSSQIESDAENVRQWLRDGKTVYVYYNNDEKGYAVENARELKSKLAQS